MPSRVPTMVKLNKISESSSATTTHITSNTILTLPKFFPNVEETAFTKASPEFIITFSITQSAIPNPRIRIPINTSRIRTGYILAGIPATIHMPRSVNQPNRKDNGICNCSISRNLLRRTIICPIIRTQFQIISQFPKVRNGNRQLSTFATEEIGDTPSSPCLVNATPNAEKTGRALIIHIVWKVLIFALDKGSFHIFASIKNSRQAGITLDDRIGDDCPSDLR